MAFLQSNTLARNLLLGFLAGALAVATFHQATIAILTLVKMINGNVYSMRPVAPWGVPQILNQMFWGGLWGVVFAAIIDRVPPRKVPLWALGFIFGVLGPVLIGWLVVAPIKGQPIMGGFVPMRMLASVLINGAFGVGVALIFTFLRGWASTGRPFLKA